MTYLKRFLLQFHYLITNPEAFVKSYMLQKRRQVFGYFVAVLFVMTGATALIRSNTVIAELPPVLAEAFDGITIENGVMKSDSVIVPLQREVAEMMEIMNGRFTPIELYPESLIVADPRGEISAPVMMKRDSLIIVLSESVDSSSSRVALELPWNSVVKDGNYEFTESFIRDYFSSQRVSLFLGLFSSNLMIAVKDILAYWLILFLFVLIYRRELRAVWRKGSSIKIVMNGSMPYLLLMPLFAMTGNRADLQSSVAIVASTVIIFRAFHFHRMKLYNETKMKEQNL